MKPSFRHFSLLALAIIILASCSKKTPKEIQYIPKDVTAVLVVNPKSLDEKLKKGNLSIDTFINRIQRNGDTMNTKEKKMWENFKNSGISFEDNIYMFLVQKGSISKGQSNVFNIIGTLKDEAKFEKFLKENDDFKDSKIEKEQSYSYITKNEGTIAWNKDVILFSFYQKDYKASFDSLGNYKMPDVSENEKDQKAEVTRYFNLKDVEKLSSVSYFNDMFKENADGYIFTTTAGTLAYLSATPLNLPKLNDLLKDNYSVTYFNFEDGRISAKGTSYTNPMLSSILKKYPGAQINTAALEKYPTQNLNGFIQLAFNPEMFNGVLKELEVGGLIDAFLVKQGLTSADIIKAFKGEMNLFVSDFAIEEREVTIPAEGGPNAYKYKKTLPSAKMIFTASVGDKAAFATVMNKAVEAGIAEKTATGYGAGSLLKFVNMYLAVDGDNFVIATDEATYKAYATGTGKSNISSDILAKVKGKSSAGYINATSLFTVGLKSLTDSTSNKMFTILNSTIKDAFFTADNFNDNGVKSEMELRMVNEKQNSLVSLCNMISDMITVFQKEEQARKAQYNNNMPQLNNAPSALDNK